MTPEQKDKWDSLVAATEEWSKRSVGVENDAILAADAELKRLRTQRDALLGALKRCLPIIQADAQMMADISRHAPLPYKDQIRHDMTEYESERLVREIPALIASVEGGAA